MCGHEPFRHLTLSPLSPHRPDFSLLHLLFVLGDIKMLVVFLLSFPFFSVFNEFFILFHRYRKNNNEATVSTQKEFSPKSHCGQSAATIIDFMNPTKEDC